MQREKVLESYYEDLSKLEEATENLQKELLHLIYNIEGMTIAYQEIESSKYYMERISHLSTIKRELESIEISVSEEEIQIELPEIFIMDELVEKKSNFDPIYTISCMRNLRNGIAHIESEWLKGAETSYSNRGKAYALLRAIDQFERAFLNYVA